MSRHAQVSPSDVVKLAAKSVELVSNPDCIQTLGTITVEVFAITCPAAAPLFTPTSIKYTAPALLEGQSKKVRILLRACQRLLSSQFPWWGVESYI
jgi:hypothetical protein